MSKKSPKAAPAAAMNKKPENNGQAANSNTPSVEDLRNAVKDPAYMRGLSPDSQVLLTRTIHEIFSDPGAAEKLHMDVTAVNLINEVNAVAVIAIFANEVTMARNAFAIRMRQSQLQKIQEVANSIGVNLNMNLLPAPSAEGIVEVPSTAIEVPEEVKQKLKEEEEIKKTAENEFDPTKIENEEQLAETLRKIMVVKPNLIEKIQCPINFYRAYLQLQAKDNKEQLEEIKKMSEAMLFKNLATFLKSSPLVLTGIGSHMYTITAGSKSVVPAFTILRDASKNKTTGMPNLSDEMVASYISIIINWVCDIKVAEQEKRHADLTKNLAELSKNKKQNAKGIEETKEKLDTVTKNISHINEVRDYVNNPSFDVVDNWPTAFAEKDNAANRIYGAIVKSYYDDIEVKEMKRDGLLHNVHQYIGVITNMFRSADAQNENYNEANIIPLEPAIATTEDDDSKKDLLPIKASGLRYCAAFAIISLLTII